MFPEYNGFWKPQRRVWRVYLHCSASPHKHHSNAATIDQLHIERGWSGIGYHYFIGFDGKIETGRNLEKILAAQHGHNGGSIAICLAGLNLSDFTTDQFNALRRLCLDIDKAYDGKVTFHGHNEVSKKSCPVYDYRKELRLIV